MSCCVEGPYFQIPDRLAWRPVGDRLVGEFDQHISLSASSYIYKSPSYSRSSTHLHPSEQASGRDSAQAQTVTHYLLPVKQWDSAVSQPPCSPDSAWEYCRKLSFFRKQKYFRKLSRGSREDIRCNFSKNVNFKQSMVYNWRRAIWTTSFLFKK